MWAKDGARVVGPLRDIELGADAQCVQATLHFTDPRVLKRAKQRLLAFYPCLQETFADNALTIRCARNEVDELLMHLCEKNQKLLTLLDAEIKALVAQK
jgi:hypothetical protein